MPAVPVPDGSRDATAPIEQRDGGAVTHDEDGGTTGGDRDATPIESDAGDTPPRPPPAGDTGEAKIFGYVFGDGNYTSDSAPPTDATFFSHRPEMLNDILGHACDADYAVRLDGHAFPCSPFTPLVGDTASGALSSGRRITIPGYRWPHGGDLDAATGPEIVAFISGLLPTEGSRSGLILDQFPNIPAGHYLTTAALDHKLEMVAAALRRIGFATVHLTRGDGSTACTVGAGDCREVHIRSADFCRLNSSYGFDIVLYARVPGASATSISATTDPRAYAEPDACP